MCGTIDQILEKPSNLPRMIGDAVRPFDPLGGAINKFAGDAITDVSRNPLASGVATGLAGYFGGPWGSALAQSSLARERGDDWGSALTQGAMAGGMTYAAGQAFGGDSAGAAGAEGGTAEPMMDYGMGEGGAYSPAAGSQQSTWAQPSSGFEAGAEPMMDYGMGGADMSQATYAQGGGLADEGAGFSLKDWLKGDGSKTGQFGRMQMIQGGMKGLGGIYDYQAKNKMAEDLMSRYNQEKTALDQYYAAGSPEAKAMEEQMARQDAAAGRRSQYGTRATNLAAQLAQTRANYRAQMAPGLNQLYSQAGQLRASAPAGLFGGASQALTGYGLSSLF